MNSVEGFPIWIALLLLSGIQEKTALTAMICSIVIFVGRLIYALSYSKLGPNFRVVGGLMTVLSTYVLFGTSIYSVIQFM
mmetsp:Transcript_26194/g.25365  ORF Transcript_26194/g.25365 Transcript_26194/m.25365 type:complete len:80 (+) Transcript_26194:298-537(+)